MCIRDRVGHRLGIAAARQHRDETNLQPIGRVAVDVGDLLICLLYTSDAADERSSVDLGGRRIIKKKNHYTLCGTRLTRHSKPSTGQHEDKLRNIHKEEKR